MNDPANSPDTDELTEELIGLLFESSPYISPDGGNIDAIVQHDGRAVYFYLNGGESFGTRACWVRNLQQGPLVLNEEEMASGLPPMLPKTYCADAKPQPAPNPDDLQIVWLEEGNGAALLEHGQAIAMIPPWSGVDGFHGYSAACAVESPLCWPMPENDSLQLRIRRSIEFWESCKSEHDHPFAVLQPKLIEFYESKFAAPAKYFAIDGGQFPPRGACIFRPANQDSITIATVGMSLRPQPNVEMFVENPVLQRRVELAISIPGNPTDQELQPLLEQISGLVSFPWQQWTWFGHGHTCAARGLDRLFKSSYSLVAFTAELEGRPRLDLEFRGDPVNLLWMHPITDAEQKQLAGRELTLADLAATPRV